MTERAILSVKWTPASGIGRVGGFVRYVSFRDHHQDVVGDRRLEGLLRYVAHRDPTATRGRVFSADGPAGDRARAELVRFVQRSCAPARTSSTRRPERAVYRFVLSPELAEGLDLKRLARATMLQLERDAGGLGPWIAAEHRNTAHPHVHIVLAAKREMAPDRYRSIVLTRERLARMKLAIGHDMQLQREGRPMELDWSPPRGAVQRTDEATRRAWRARRSRHLSGVSLQLAAGVRRALKRAAIRYQLEAERERLQRERERGWER